MTKPYQPIGIPWLDITASICSRLFADTALLVVWSLVIISLGMFISLLPGILIHKCIPCEWPDESSYSMQPGFRYSDDLTAGCKRCKEASTEEEWILCNRGAR